MQVCSIHFIDGQPTKQHPTPVLKMGYNPRAPQTPIRRPLVRRHVNKENKPPVSNQLSFPVQQCNDAIEHTANEHFIAEKIQPENEPCQDRLVDEQCESLCCHRFPQHCRHQPVLVDSSTQTVDIVALDHNYIYNKKTKNTSTQCTTPEFGIDNITTDSESIFYTGLHLTMFLNLVKVLSIHGEKLPFRLKISDQILSVLVRLRLALSFQDIARRFNVSHQLISKIFHSWINIMAKHLSDCVVWLPRDTIRRTLPESFKLSFPKTTCIIDCSEVFIQRPFSLKARSLTWSTYKHNNTAKFLIAIAPNGFIMFVSPTYGGRASDNFITKHSGFLNYLLPGDEIMADRGFTIGEDLCALRVKLNIPAFMQGRSQLSEEEVIDSRRIAAERIHVERAIMRMKSYRILNTKMTIKTLRNADKKIRVVSALCNMRGALIKEEVE